MQKTRIYTEEIDRYVKGSAKDWLPCSMNSPPVRSQGSRSRNLGSILSRAQYLVRVGAAAIRGRVDLILHIFEVSRGHG